MNRVAQPICSILPEHLLSIDLVEGVLAIISIVKAGIRIVSSELIASVSTLSSGEVSRRLAFLQFHEFLLSPHDLVLLLFLLNWHDCLFALS